MRSDLALAALACAALPGMKPVSVSGIGPTDDDPEVQRALVVDTTGRSWVVHSPLTPVAGARLQRNDELVRQLSRHVPYKVPAAAGHASVGKDGAAVVYPYVEGSALDFGRLPSGPGLSSAVGRTIAAVHNIPRGVFEEQDVPVFDAAGCRQRAIALVDRAAETGRVPTGLLARWEEAFDAAALWQFATTPVHGNLRGSSLLVAFADDDDAASGRVVAVLGWEEAAIADPASDLAQLYHLTTPQAWDAVLESYTLARAQRPDPYLQARARLIAEIGALHGLAHAVAEGAEEAVRRTVEALRRMDRLTEDDDSLVPSTARSSAGHPKEQGVRQGAEPHPGSVAIGYDEAEAIEIEDIEGEALDTGGLDIQSLDAETGDPDVPEEADPTIEVPVNLPSETPGPSDLAATTELAEVGESEESGEYEDLGESEESGEYEDLGESEESGENEDRENEELGGGDGVGGNEDLDRGERLHELYGMPEVDRGDGER